MVLSQPFRRHLKKLLSITGLAAFLCTLHTALPIEARAQNRDQLGIPADVAQPEQGTEMQIPEFQAEAPARQEQPPASADLATPAVEGQPQEFVDAPPQEDAAPAAEAAVAGDAAASPQPLIPDGASQTYNEDLFYDAGNIVPAGELSRRVPRKVNPALEPASKLIVVTKESGPESQSAQLVSASRALTLGRYDSALDIYQGLYSTNPKNKAVLMGVAVSLQRMGDADAAIAAYDELLDIDPKNVDAEVNMLGLLSEKYPQVALHRLNELHGKNPSHMGVVAQLAVTNAQMGNIEDAIRYLGTAASMEPQNANHVFNMAVIADRAGKKTQAVEFYEQALEIDSIYSGSRTLPRDAIFERLARLR